MLFEDSSNPLFEATRQKTRDWNNIRYFFSCLKKPWFHRNNGIGDTLRLLRGEGISKPDGPLITRDFGKTFKEGKPEEFLVVIDSQSLPTANIFDTDDAGIKRYDGDIFLKHIRGVISTRMLRFFEQKELSRAPLPVIFLGKDGRWRMLCMNPINKFRVRIRG